MTTSATDTAKAANSLPFGIQWNSQEALLEVMTDYFTSPEGGRDSESGKDADEFDNGQMKLQGTAKMNAISTDTISYRV